MKIAVIGYSGSGKSTLAKKLGEMYHCPVLHLDRINFEPGWKTRDREEGKKLVEAFMEQDSWIIDGNYGEFLQERRLEEADRIIFMNFPRAVSFYQAFHRYLTSGNQTRDSMAEGCQEKFDFEFMAWILYEGRTKKRRDHYKEICEQYKDKVTVCRNRRDVRGVVDKG